MFIWSDRGARLTLIELGSVGEELWGDISVGFRSLGMFSCLLHRRIER